jgi:chromosome segregation ATPase
MYIIVNMKNKNLLKIPLLALLFNDTSSMENDYTIAYKGLSITQHQEKKINKLGELLALEQEKNHIFSVKVQELTAEHYRLVDRINHLLSELEASNSQKEDFQKQTHELKREVESKNENIIMLEKNIKTQKELLRTSENRIEDLTRTVEVQYANKNTSLRSSQEEIKTSKENFSRELN